VGSNIHGLIEIRSAKYDAGVGHRRPERHEDLFPRVKPYSRGSNRIFKRSLIQH
jgi:hypothetical protein